MQWISPVLQRNSLAMSEDNFGEDPDGGFGTEIGS